MDVLGSRNQYNQESEIIDHPAADRVRSAFGAEISNYQVLASIIGG